MSGALATARPVRVALIGAGGINSAHVPAFEKHPEIVEMAGVADPSPGLAEKLATRFGAPFFDDAAAMLDTLGDRVDAVLITTPHHLHFPLAAEALRRGLPALVEKPALISISQLHELQALEQKHGAFVQAGQMQRFGQEENWLKRWLQSEAFGEPRLFNLEIYQNIEGYVSHQPDGWILDKNKAGGGVVISVAVHILDLLRYWLEDDFVEVYAQGRFDAPFKNGAESTCVVAMKTRRGMLGTLNASYTATRCPHSQRSLLLGTNGTLAQQLDRVGGGYAGPYYIASSGGRPSPEWNMMYEGFEKVADRMAAEPEFASGTDSSPFTAQMLAFAEAVRGRTAPRENSLTRNANTIAVIEAIGRSMTSGKPESVEGLA